MEIELSEKDHQLLQRFNNLEPDEKILVIKFIDDIKAWKEFFNKMNKRRPEK